QAAGNAQRSKIVEPSDPRRTRGRNPLSQNSRVSVPGAVQDIRSGSFIQPPIRDQIRVRRRQIAVPARLQFRRRAGRIPNSDLVNQAVESIAGRARAKAAWVSPAELKGGRSLGRERSQVLRTYEQAIDIERRKTG